MVLSFEEDVVPQAALVLESQPLKQMDRPDVRIESPQPHLVQVRELKRPLQSPLHCLSTVGLPAITVHELHPKSAVVPMRLHGLLHCEEEDADGLGMSGVIRESVSFVHSGCCAFVRQADHDTQEALLKPLAHSFGLQFPNGCENGPVEIKLAFRISLELGEDAILIEAFVHRAKNQSGRAPNVGHDL